MNSQILLQIQIFANNGPGERVLLYGLSLPAYYYSPKERRSDVVSGT